MRKLSWLDKPVTPRGYLKIEGICALITVGIAVAWWAYIFKDKLLRILDKWKPRDPRYDDCSE